MIIARASQAAAIISQTQCSLLSGYSLDAIGGGYYSICDQLSHLHVEDRI